MEMLQIKAIVGVQSLTRQKDSPHQSFQHRDRHILQIYSRQDTSQPMPDTAIRRVMYGHGLIAWHLSNYSYWGLGTKLHRSKELIHHPHSSDESLLS